MANSYFTNKTLLITGGTGSFGNTVLKHFLASDIGEIRIFSRDEKKQDDMRHEIQQKHPELAGKLRGARRGLHLPRRSPEAGAQLRVFPHGGRAHQRGRHRQRAHRRH